MDPIQIRTGSPDDFTRNPLNLKFSHDPKTHQRDKQAKLY